ncbi:hypothetical protein G7075_12265 [Phycicoccus sp. HDW14]|uniref:right-handed parallel beta-helix repeat-containing protein n=1 Tax=Phycicoccus sp. HDW14 TaxID=2714941 RepID=UPI00140AF895|nr:right-handed parallel beta-helix repeat-containing protein [Phycicoccus sp. HDW14]QIM21720.1 hypothetical protein G7075_12265 [Phycicoccus sp. HDW14]
MTAVTAGVLAGGSGLVALSANHEPSATSDTRSVAAAPAKATDTVRDTTATEPTTTPATTKAKPVRVPTKKATRSTTGTATSRAATKGRSVTSTGSDSGRSVAAGSASGLQAHGIVVRSTKKPTPAPVVPAGTTCDLKPSASTTGATGTRSNSSVTTLTSGQTLANVNVKSLNISGSNVTVRNVKVTDGILVTGDNVTISHVTTPDIGISSARHVLVEYTNIGFSQNDAIHVTSDRGRQVQDVTLRYNYLHDPRPPADAHYDGTQVRGVNGMKVSCSVYDAGKYTSQLNAAIYLEDANGGNSNVTLDSNWLYGTGISLFIDPSVNTVATKNRIGGDLHWGPCYQNSKSKYTSSGNVWDATDKAVNLCGNG